ncbi:TIGR01777 family oxidoreductase [Microlunatus ginsengisoli]|uniref:TIGR01777 family oxidoreductase n=1 Tax=Microlunatus ginsengisoli TaxID=363863 RepID=A0ABP6ZS59_9ACTN
MRYLLAGSSGFLGTALRVDLAAQGHQAARLVRREPATATEYRWDPDAGSLDPSVFDGVDVVVNLCGVGIADRAWTKARRELLRSSRINPTRTLALALAERSAPLPVLIQGSAIGWYGTEPTDVPLTEAAPAAEDFIGELVEDWERAAQPAAQAGVRTVFLRTSPVMDRGGGAFQPMRTAWSLGLATKLGDGSQHMPMIALDDWLRALQWAAETADAQGPYNLTIPQPSTNAEFTDALADALHRPSLFKAPAGLVRLGLGELAEQLVGDIWVVPQRLVEGGFVFTAPDARGVVRAALRRS